VDTTRTDHPPNNPSHPTPRARDLRERLDSAADEGLSRRRLDAGVFRRFVDDVKARTDLVALIGRGRRQLHSPHDDNYISPTSMVEG
jgi:hypothetical protein